MNDRQRTLDWEGCHNVRELGDLPTRAGGWTRRGSLIRSDLLGRLSARGKRQLLDYGVRTIVDLRTGEEIAKDPPAVFEPPARAPRYLPLAAEEFSDEAWALMKQAETRAELYILSLDYGGRSQARILRAIAGADAGPLVFHCHSGKDRTGITAALLLDLAGVRREAIAADYAETQKRLWPSYQQWLAETGKKEASSRWYIPITEPETMLETLAHLDRQYGGTEAYLRGTGLNSPDLEKLRARLT